MPAVDLEGKVCPKHPQVQAVARCFGCFKPICEECLVVSNSLDFCSIKCAESHARTSETFDKFTEHERRQRLRRRIRSAITLVLLLIVGYVAIMYWINNPGAVAMWYESITGMIGGLKDTLVETIQGLTGS